MKNLVIGLGISGQAAVRYLVARKQSVLAVDRFEGALSWDFDRVVVSPGVAPSHPLYREALERGIAVVGEAELALQGCTQRCVGITGTNGKSTTVMQVTHLLNAGGVKARAVGNIGTPLCDVVGGDEVLVIELSSYQLETMVSPVLEVGVLMNITPDHLDRYGSMEAYAAAKWRIKDLVKEGGLFLEGRERNLDYVEAIAAHFGVPLEPLKTFVGLEHRLERFKEVEGISFVNDSKGTNVAATVHAVRATSAPVVLLAGGVDKGGGYGMWKEAFAGRVKRIVVFGQAKKKIMDELSGYVECIEVENLKEATRVAFEGAERGDAILLSPGCSSFDQFKNYEDRGRRFKEYVEELG